MTWDPVTDPAERMEVGTEGGVVLLDEEHGYGARITLERDCAVAPFAITCGIYGWMMHTRFFASESDARQAIVPMKAGIDSILQAMPLSSDPLKDEKMAETTRQIEAFVERFPT